MSKLELPIGYIVDAILKVKEERFKENFTTFGEINIIKLLIEKRIQQKKLNVKFIDDFFEKYFDIINGIITKSDKETLSLRPYISNTEIGDIIYDEQTIYVCLSEIMKDRIQNSDDEKNQIFYCNNVKVVFDDNGYVKEATGFMSIMWMNPNQQNNFIGIHITELAQILKKYAINREAYIGFLEGVVLKFYNQKEIREKQKLVNNILTNLSQNEEQELILKKTRK